MSVCVQTGDRHSPCNTYESPGFDQPSHDTLTCPSLKDEGRSASHCYENGTVERNQSPTTYRNRRTHLPVYVVSRSSNVRATNCFGLVNPARLADAGELRDGVHSTGGSQSILVEREGGDVLELDTRHLVPAKIVVEK